MRPKRILIAYSASSTHVSTTLEYLKALKNFTDYEVKYVHVTNDAQMQFDFNEFDVLFHNYCARLCFDGYLSPDYERAVASFRGLKIASVQDDYDRTSALHRSIRRLGFRVVLTSIQKDFWPLAYPNSQVPGVRLVNVLTGYMPVNTPADLVPLAARKNLIAYRGRDIGAKYGRLGFEKYEIGRRMIDLCEESNIPHDIAMDDASRIYGDDWYKFLGHSRAMLGSESGSNAFDFDGEIEKRCLAFQATHGRPPRYPDLADFIEPFERPFDVGQISPRIFECAMMRTPMVLFRGRYSDAIKPGTHYIPLEKDFSNATEILSRLRDDDFLAGVADRAFDHLVASGNYGYRALANLVSGVIEEEYSALMADEFEEHRRKCPISWTPPTIPAFVGSREDAIQIALGEKPTDEPLSLDYFLSKQARFAEAQAGPLRFRATADIVADGQLSVLRQLWHLLPRSRRYAVAAWLRKHVA